MNLQFFFIIASLYGWYEWKFGKKDKNKQKLTITFLPNHLFLNVSIMSIGCFGVVFFVLRQLKGDFLLIDAITTTLSVVATWLMARKYVENWILWIIADVLYVGMYFQKEAYLYTILYAIFLGMATKGFIDWRKKSFLEAN